MNTKIKALGIIALGGIVGGVTSYFLATLVIDQILKSQEEFEWDEEEENTYKEVEVGKAENVKKSNKKTDYTRFSEKGPLEELVKPYTNSSGSKQDSISIISLEEYENDRTFNIEEISYYSGDTTFCNMNEEPIPNPEDFFGPNPHLHFGDKSNDPDIVYIRNKKNGVNYEITQLPGKYSVTVLGMPDEEPKETKAKRRKTTKKEEPFEKEEADNEGDD